MEDLEIQRTKLKYTNRSLIPITYHHDVILIITTFADYRGEEMIQAGRDTASVSVQ